MKTEQKREERLRVPYPIKMSEFEVQSNLYQQLAEEGLHVRGCVPAWSEDFGKDHRVYLDLVVFNSLNEAVLIIECKNRCEDSPERGLRGRQSRRYTKFGVPVLLCDRSSKIKETIERVLDLTSYEMFC